MIQRSPSEMPESLTIVVLVAIAMLIAAVSWAAIEMRLLRRVFNRRSVFMLAYLIGNEAHAQQKEFVGPQQPARLKRLWTPADAQAAALADLLTLRADQRLLTRYIWLQDPSDEGVKSVSATLNRISRSTTIFRPVPLAENRLVRFNLFQLSFDVDKDLAEITDVWESLRFEPKFNLLLTPDTLKVVLGLPAEQRPVAVVRTANGFESRALDKLAEADVVRLNASHLDPKTTLTLQAATFSAAPIVSKEYFELRALNSIKDKGPFATIFGGLYYEFRNIGKTTKKGQTDLDFLLEGIGATGKRVAEQRVGMFRSGITGKPRAIDFLPATNLRVGDGQAFVVITDDVKDESIDASQHPIMTLRKQSFKVDGHEVIFSGNNGIQSYALFDGQGALVDVVPDTIASDSTIPAQFPKRLQSASSCIRCHEAEGSDGLKPVVNDVQTLLDRGLDVFGDASDPAKPIFRTIQELGSQYKGHPDKFIRQARFQYQSAMLDATGPWSNTKPTDILKQTAKRLETDTNAYWYGPVTADVAIRELGFAAVPKDQAGLFLRRLLRPDADTLVNGILPEDVRIGALLLDLPISRIEWSFVFPFAQARANKELQNITGKKP